MAAAELTLGLVELLGPLEVADVAAAWDHDQLGVRNRLLELAGDPERRTRIELAPQINSVGTAMRGIRSRWSASAITNSCFLGFFGAHVGGDLLE